MTNETSEEATKEFVGVIYPIPLNLIHRFFDQGKNVFVKYLPKPRSYQPKVGDKVLFYASHDIHKIVGEGAVQNVEFLEPKEALEKYRENLFLSKEELEQYRLHRSARPQTKKLLVVVLKNLRKYSKLVEPEKPITMTGRRITKKEYRTLRTLSN